MSFLSPGWLWLLAAVAGLAIGYVLLQRRRQTYAVRFTNIELLDVVAPERPRWRRHLPAAALLVAMAALVTAMARPAREVEVAREEATMVVALDTSISMNAEDVEPNRMEAARSAATSFVAGLPEGLDVGLVTFNENTTVDVSPTDDHDLVVRAIEDARVSPGTAIGDALVASVGAAQSGAANLEDPNRDRSLDQGTDGQPVPAVIVLLSDGKTTVGRPDAEGVAAAVAAGIPVTTIAFGTDAGLLQQPDGLPLAVPVDRAALRLIAEQTGGSFFEAASEKELSDVYASIDTAVAYDSEQREISQWFVGGGLLALLAAAGMSLAWFSRLP